MTEQNAKIDQATVYAIEHCVSMTDTELERAYGRNSILGNGEICDIYLAEMDRRAANNRAA